MIKHKPLFASFRMPETEKFAFGVIDKKLAFTQNKDVQSLFEKWDLKLDIQYFNFDKVCTLKYGQPHLY